QQSAIALVGRVPRHAGIAEHRLRPRRGDDDARTAIFGRIADVPETARLAAVGRLRLFVRERRLTAHAPMNDAVAAIDQPLLIEADEHLAHRLRKALVHREALALPIARRAEAHELLEDLAAVLPFPLTDKLVEPLAHEIV